MDSHKNWKLKHKQPSFSYKIKHRLLRFVHCVVPWSPVNSLIRGPQSHLRVKEHQSLFTWLHLTWTVVVEMNSTQKTEGWQSLSDQGVCGLACLLQGSGFVLQVWKKSYDHFSPQCFPSHRPSPFLNVSQSPSTGLCQPSSVCCITSRTNYQCNGWSLLKKPGGAMTQLPSLPDHVTTTATTTKQWLYWQVVFMFVMQLCIRSLFTKRHSLSQAHQTGILIFEDKVQGDKG